MNEAELDRAIADAAQLFGWRRYHTFDSRRSASGFPDLVLVRRGRLIFAELKTDTGKITDAQAEWLADLGMCSGVEVHRWRPSDWHSGAIERTLR